MINSCKAATARNWKVKNPLRHLNTPSTLKLELLNNSLIDNNLKNSMVSPMKLLLEKVSQMSLLSQLSCQ